MRLGTKINNSYSSSNCNAIVHLPYLTLDDKHNQQQKAPPPQQLSSSASVGEMRFSAAVAATASTTADTSHVQ